MTRHLEAGHFEAKTYDRVCVYACVHAIVCVCVCARAARNRVCICVYVRGGVPPEAALYLCSCYGSRVAYPPSLATQLDARKKTIKNIAMDPPPTLPAHSNKHPR